MADVHSSVSYADVPGFPGYRVGDDGSVWSCRKQGRYPAMLADWHQLKPRPVRHGYLGVSLYRTKNGKRVSITWCVHVMVLVGFVGPCPPGLECLHKDGDKLNNRLSNLRWGTHVENSEDARRHGTLLLGESCNRAKLTAQEVLLAVEARKAGESRVSVGARLGVSGQMIWCIDTGRAWNHITGLPRPGKGTALPVSALSGPPVQDSDERENENACS